ncbi:MAG: sialidase family protein [Thermoanaerobaculia bacterium]|nr:sialidase family protein [Thermoanaerobaculia bacterium]
MCTTFAAAAGAAGDSAIVLSQPIFGEEAPFVGCHASTVAESRRGLVAAWFAGTDEGYDDVGIWLAHRQGEGWTAPVEIDAGVVDGRDYPCWNPVLHQASDGSLLLFYKVGPSPREWWGQIVRSRDGGRTWSPPERLPDGILGPVRAKPIVLEDGTLLAGSSTEHDGWRLHFERSRDLGRTWESTGPIHDGRSIGGIQPTLLRHSDGRLQALFRTRRANRIGETWSSDGGRTWSEPELTALPNPSAGIDAVTLADGRHLLVYNHTSRLPGERPEAGLRSELNLAVSDDGESWRAALLLERQPGEYSYPAMILGSDGRLHITYTFRRRGIQYVVVAPERLEARYFENGRWPR